MLTRDHTVLPATHVYPQVEWEWTIHAFTPQRQTITALWLILISHPAEGRRLSWPGWLVKYWGGLSAEDGHPYHTNRARCRVTSLIRPTTLPLRHAARGRAVVEYYIDCWVRSMQWCLTSVQCGHHQPSSATVPCHVRLLCRWFDWACVCENGDHFE